jgi:hypothetical protein
VSTRAVHSEQKLRDKKALNGIVRHEKMLVSINASSPLNEKKPSLS